MRCLLATMCGIGLVLIGHGLARTLSDVSDLIRAFEREVTNGE